MTDQRKAQSEHLSELMAARKDLAEMSQRIAQLEVLDLEHKQFEKALTSLLKLSQTLVSAYDVDDVVDQAIKSAVDIATASDKGSLQLLSETSDMLLTVAVSGTDDKLLDTISFQPGMGIAGHALVSGRTINVPDVLEDERFVPSKLPLRFRSLLVAPLMIKGRRLGTLSLSSEQIGAFSATHEALIQLIADQTAVALENARLFTERKKAEAELQAHRDHLEELVKERTAELRQANEQLRQEIVERRRAEEALAESEKRYRAIVEDQTELICRFLPDGTLTFVNQAYCRYFGKRREEMLGRSLMPVAHESDQAAREERIALLNRDKPVQTYEHQMMSLGQEVRWQQWTDRAIFDEQSRLVEFQSVGRDITERKRLERQLLQSQKMEAIGRLAGGIAHDFNNILTVITAYSDLLLRRLTKDDPLYGNIMEIHKAGDRAASLTSQLLAFSRKQMLQPKILDLNTVITDMDKMLRRLIGEHIELITVLGADLGKVKADPGQIEQVIMNLIVNARDAMPQGGEVRVETANITLDEDYSRRHVGVLPGPYVLLVISDTGKGMDAEIQGHIFEPFFTTKTHATGTGLGLATVFGIVKQSDGHIEVESQHGRGATFRIYLPHLVEASEVHEEQAIIRSESPSGSETILLVEDESNVRGLVFTILEEKGYTVLEASHGEAALQLAAEYEGPIHLLLTDVVMPGGMSGRDLTDHLRPLRPEMKVLYISGYTENTIVHHGILDPGLDLLQKPFTSDVLAHKVREVLDRADV